MWKRQEDEMPTTSPPGPTHTPARSPAPPSSGGNQAVIGPSIAINGDITGQEDLLVQGTVEGKIDLGDHQVVVGEKGRVKADIRGRVIVVEGKVEGNLFGSEQVLLRRSSAVRGNITAPRVSLDDGTNFKGAIDMEPKPPRRPEASVPGGKPGGGGLPGPSRGPAEKAGDSDKASDAGKGPGEAGNTGDRPRSGGSG